MLPVESATLQSADLATIMDILTRNTKKIFIRAKHCYSRKIVTNKRCDYCKKTMFLLALRCKDCRFKCHRKCAENASPRCMLTLPRPTPQAPSKGRNHQQDKMKNKLVQSPQTSCTNKNGYREGGATHGVIKPCHICGDGPDNVDLRRASDCDACRRLQQATPPASPQYSVGTKTRYSALLRDDCRVPDPMQDSGLCEDLVSSSRYTEQIRYLDQEPPTIKTQRWSSHHEDVSSSSCGYCTEDDNDNSEAVFSSCPDEPNSCLCSGGGPLEMSRAEKQRKWSRGEKAKTVDVTATRKREAIDMGQSLIATWPPHAHCGYKADAVPESIDDAHRVCDSLAASRYIGGDDHDIREAVKEWSIPHENLKYGTCLRAGRNGSTYRGNWHGEVLIHTRLHVEDVNTFLEEVSVLSMIRHENIALFMGACIDPPQLAVVTCVQKGPSLYQHLHIKQSKSPMHSRINIARQIAQGMGYLHARGIVVGDLNTKAVFLESKVKLCLTGYDTTDGMCQREDYASVPRGHLTYIAPEILRTIRVQPPYLVEHEPHTIESDVYAFGTVMYELLTSQWPFTTTHACVDSVIYLVCTGERGSLAGVKCIPSIKCLVEDCWSHVPNMRPSFPELVDELNQNVALVNMKHSLSEPDNLNRIGRPW